MEFFNVYIDINSNLCYHRYMEKQNLDYEYYHINTTVTTDIFPVDVGHQVFEPDSPDIHNNYPYYLLHFVVKGKGSIEIDGQTHIFGRNDVFILHPDTHIVYRSDPANPWEYYWINFNGLQAKNILQKLGITDEKYFVSVPLPETKKYFVQALRAKSDLFGRTYTVLGNLYGIFGCIAQAEQHTASYDEKKKILFDDIFEYIRLHLYDTELSAQSVAQHFYISPAYFSCLFKKHLNVSFKEYVNYERIKKATELIETSHLYVKSIGHMVGFADPLYFGKVFKKYRLYSPAEYKKRIQTKQ